MEEYSEEISTWRWKLFEEKGLFKRSEITNQEYINFLKGNYKNLQFGKKDRTEERQGIQGVNDEFYVFHPINDIAFDEDGKLKVTEKNKGMKKAFSRVIEHINKAPMDETKLAVVVHTNNPQGAEELAALIEKHTGVKPWVTIMGPVIGAHVGPGSVSCGWVSVKTRAQLQKELYSE